MNRLFESPDPAACENQARAIPLHGQVIAIRLEAAFWPILEEIAEAEGMSLPLFLAALHAETVARHGEVPNFGSLLRVSCVQFLTRGAARRGGA